ncbi:hypothetical protein J0H58_26150 [bacterium]|nr:hypothetical protein [bacterium]
MSKPRNAAVSIPNPLAHADVVAVSERHDGIAAELASVRRDITAAETALGARPGTPDHEIAGRLIAAGRPTEAVTRLRELRGREKELAYALGLIADELKDVTARVKRELSAQTRERIFLPAVREAVAVWLTACQAMEQFRRLVDRIQNAGVGANTFCPFNGRVPLCLADFDGFQAFARELVTDGFTDPGTINAALPDVL